MTKQFELVEEARSRILIAAHRGLCGGNIPCNTLAAFDAALCNGADMIELDVGMDRDGGLYIFHEGLEAEHLGIARRLQDLKADEIKALRYRNQDHTPTSHGMNTLDEAFEHLKSRCYINVDKFAPYMGPIVRAIRRHGIQEQILIKTNAERALFDRIEAVAPDLCYIPIVQNEDTVTEYLLRRPLRFIGVEAVFETEDAPVCQTSYIQAMHEKGLILWGNGIVYDYKRVLSAGHSDDVSITGNPDAGWGWLAARGFDIIQTDWPTQLRAYLLKNRGA